MKIAAIARLMIRTGFHSRVFAAMLALVLCLVIGLPLTIKGDGTLVGQARIMIEYALGSVGALLALAVAWLACGAVSLELTDRQLQLVMTKPVHHLQVWLGKWLGIVLMAGALLAIAGAIVGVMLLLRFQPGRLGPDEARILREEVLVTRQTLFPEPDDVSAAMERALASRAKGAEGGDFLSEAQWLKIVARNLRRNNGTLAPDQGRSWRIRLPRKPRPQESLMLRFTFASSRPERPTAKIVWQIGDEPPREISLQPSAEGVLPVPPATIGDDLTVAVSATNRSADPPSTIIFEPDAGVSLTLESPGIGGNYFRALLLMFGKLALLAALGLTAGCLFSMPTASFVTIFSLLLMALSGYITTAVQSGIAMESHVGDVVGLGQYPLPVRWIFTGLAALLQPLQAFNPIQRLASNELIPWSLTLRGLVIFILIYSGVLGLLGSFFFRRREIALPGG